MRHTAAMGDHTLDEDRSCAPGEYALALPGRERPKVLLPAEATPEDLPPDSATEDALGFHVVAQAIWARAGSSADQVGPQGEVRLPRRKL
jgi:hypothetical protein